MRAMAGTLLIALMALAAAGPAGASNYRDVERAVNDDAMLATAGIEASKIALRKQCTAAIMSTDDPPNFFDCVYVQTDHDLNLFSLEEGYLMSELQLTLTSMDGVALQHMGRYMQIQIFSGDRVTALYIHNGGWIDPKQTQAVYEWLVGHGVSQRQPRKWIGP